MRTFPRTLVVLIALVVVGAACQAVGSPSPSPTAQVTAEPTATPTEGPATPNPDDLLAKVLAAGKLVVSTDAAYPPQSELANGQWEGFDIDVGTEIAKRLGVTVEFTAQDWAIITAGNWSGRWDVSVGSMTITSDRIKTFDFSPPYYFTPAQMAASTQSGITTIEELAGKTVCVGEATTYFTWLTGATLDLGPGTIVGTKPPDGVQTVTRLTDRDCAEEWRLGRFTFEGWLSSSTTVDQAIKDGLPLIAVGTPAYHEPLAVAVDKSGPAHAEFMRELARVIFEMHADGTLVAFSEKWFGLDLTKKL